MKIDIWSDIMCPFCYIGKRHLETAIQKLEKGTEVEIEWHSFQLDPGIQSQPGETVYSYLAKRKGWPMDYTIQAHDRLVQWAKSVDLDYRFDIAVVANSFKAHRLIQLAKTHGKSDEVEENLFRAYFTEGKNMDDENTLVEIGISAGIPENEIREIFMSGTFTTEVNDDIALAASLGIRGVPFFLIDNKYGISGAQPVEVFTQTFDKVLRNAG